MGRPVDQQVVAKQVREHTMLLFYPHEHYPARVARSLRNTFIQESSTLKSLCFSDSWGRITNGKQPEGIQTVSEKKPRN